jgi:hypothetical protein
MVVVILLYRLKGSRFRVQGSTQPPPIKSKIDFGSPDIHLGLSTTISLAKPILFQRIRG